MRRMSLNFHKFHLARFSKIAAIAMLLTGCFPTRSMAQATGPEDIFIGGRREQRTRHGGAE